MNNKRIVDALLKFRSGSSCAQSVLSVYLPELGIAEPIAHKMGAGLGAGVGRKQYICGALNAGAIVISAKMGNEVSADLETKDLTANHVRRMVNKFEEKFGSSQCLDILGIDISTDEGRKKASEAGVFSGICVSCIEEVCTELEKEFNSGNS